MTATALDPARILIVNPFGIGDVLFTTPLIRAVREAFPESWIAYLCNRRTERILRASPHLNDIFVYEKDELLEVWRASRWDGLRQTAALLRRIRQARITLAVDISLGERYSFLLMLLGVPRRVGFDYRRRGRFLTERMAINGYHGDHVVEHYRRFLRFIGVRLLDVDLELQLAPQDDRWAEAWLRARGLDRGALLVGLVPAGGVSWGIDAPYRRWGLDRFAAVGDTLVERHGATVLLFGETADAPLCGSVAAQMRHPVIDVSGQTSLGQFVGLISRLALVVCNDGGPLHLAVSRGVRTVSIFGPVDPEVYGPYAFRERHRVVTTPLPCRPCYHQFRLPPCPYNRACLNEISVEEVLAAVDDVLAAPHRATQDLAADTGAAS